jgi:hypothetical protein
VTTQIPAPDWFHEWAPTFVNGLLSRAEVQAHLDMLSTMPADTRMPLHIDTSDGTPDSDEDRRCDRCERVDATGLHLMVLPLFIQPDTHSLRAGRPAHEITSEMLSAAVNVVIGLCDVCVESGDTQ